MAVFLGDIAGMLEIFAIAGGLILLHYAAKQGGANLLRAAGWILLLSGVIVGACTVYYFIKYQSQGAYDHAHPHMMRMMDDGMMEEMHKGMMDGGMMDGGMMGGGRKGSMMVDSAVRDSIRDSHHPGSDSQ